MLQKRRQRRRQRAPVEAPSRPHARAHALGHPHGPTHHHLRAVIWDALKAAADAEDMGTVRLLLDAAGVKVASTDLTVCYDELGGCTVKAPTRALASRLLAAPGWHHRKSGCWGTHTAPKQ